MTTFIIMGVAGSGKSTVGSAVAQAMGLPFIEADEFHPSVNIDKISKGIALTDEDRVPWIDALIAEAKRRRPEHPSTHVILTCSALSKFIRKRLRIGLDGDVGFIHLHGDRITLTRRLEQRKHHFFDPNLLPSQFAALSAPRRALTLDIALPVDQLCDAIIAHITSQS